MESQQLPISLCETQERSDSTDALIKEWLFRFGVEHREDVAPRLPLWLEAFGKMDAPILERLFSRALQTCKFFPKVSEILEPLESAEKNATPEAAEEAWARVLEIRRVHWNPDIPGPFDRALARLSERVRQAARAAGVFRDFTKSEWENGALHTWTKKRFVESFTVYGELERDGFLLPDGEIKDLVAGLAQTKMVSAPSSHWSECRARGETYREHVSEYSAEVRQLQLTASKSGRLWDSPEEREHALASLGQRETDPVVIERIRAQKAALTTKGFVTQQEPAAVNA